MTDTSTTEIISFSEFDRVELERLRRERKFLRASLQEIRRAVDGCHLPGGLCPNCMQNVDDIASSALWERGEP